MRLKRDYHLRMDESRVAGRFEFGILGPVRVVVAGEDRPVAGEKLRALLGRLLVEANRPVATDRLIDELWGDDPPATARQTLHAHVARLRRLLAMDGESESRLAKVDRGYVLRVDRDELDETRFARLVTAAREDLAEGRLEAAAGRYAEALALWRGEALEGVTFHWAEAERARLEDRRVGVVEEKIDLDLQLGRSAEFLPELERLADRYPLRERLSAQLMLALYAGGRQADALAVYQGARRALDQVGLEPGPALRELEVRILNQDPRLAAAPLAVPRIQARRPLHARVLGATLALLAVATVAGAVLLTRAPPPSAAESRPPPIPADSLVEIDPATSRVVSVTRVGRDPDSLAATDEAIWVANVGDRTVSRIDHLTKEMRIVGGAPAALGITSGLNGDVWLSSFEEPVVTLIASRGRVRDGVHSVASGPPRVNVRGSAEGLAVGGGFLWVTSPSESGGDDTVSRIDLRSRQLVSSVQVGDEPMFVAFGYGSAWTSDYRGDTVSVVRPGSERAETISVSGGPLGVAAGAGSVWVVTFWNRALVRIDPETRRVVGSTRVGDGPLAVAVGGGSVWVTNRDSRTVIRIDPQTGAVIGRINVDAAPYGVRFAHGRLWVTTQQCGSPVVPCRRSRPEVG